MGFFVPLFFVGLFEILRIAGAYDGIAVPFVLVRLFLWPTSIGLMALDEVHTWSVSAALFTLMIAITNIPIYLALGGLFWWVKQRAART
jgi:hypothetical protein